MTVQQESSLNIQTYWPLVGALFLPFLCLTILMGIATPVLPLYLKQSGTSFSLIGMIVSAHAIGLLLGTLPSSSILSRVTIRHAMLLGCGVIIGSALALYQSQSNLTVFLSWMSVGLGFSLYQLGVHQFLALHINNHFRGRAVACIGGISRLGGMLGPAVGGWVAQVYGFSQSFLLMATFSMASFAIILLFVPNTRPASKSAAQNRSQTGFSSDINILWSTLRQNLRILTIAGSAQMLMQMVRKARPILIPLFASTILEMNVATVGLIMSITSFIDTLMFLPAGFVMDRFGRKVAIVPSIIIQAVGFLLVPFTVGFWSLVGAAGLIGFANGLSSGTMTTLGADLAPQHQRIPFLSIWRFQTALGFTLGPNAVGFVAQWFALLPASLTIAAIGFTSATIFVRFVPETLQKKSQF